MVIIKGEHKIVVEVHPQPFGEKLYEAMAPNGFKWAGDTWSIHGADMDDLRNRVAYTDLEEADDEEED